MADKLTHYIIFHKKLYPENTPDFPCFRYLGANEMIPKEINVRMLSHPVLWEYGFPGYNPIYQQLIFRDLSVYLNIPAPSTEFVGFCQYDMPINKDKFQLVLDNLRHNTFVGFFLYRQEQICDVLSLDKWSEVLSEYNKRNMTSHTMNDLKVVPYFLMASFVMPTWFFCKLQSELRLLLPIIFRLLNYDMRHIAGTLERTTALIIACSIKEGRLDAKLSDALDHSNTQRIHDPLRHT